MDVPLEGDGGGISRYPCCRTLLECQTAVGASHLVFDFWVRRRTSDVTNTKSTAYTAALLAQTKDLIRIYRVTVDQNHHWF